MTKVTAWVRRIAVLPLAAAGLVAVATAAAYPAHAGAARRPHVHARLEHHALQIRGTKGDDSIALRLAAGNPEVVQVDLGDDGNADFSFPRAAIDSITVVARSGDDRVRIEDANGAFTNSIPTRIDGGPGNDTIAGGAGAETLLGSSGNDTIDGNGGNDISDLGAGDDSFVWDPGDGSDTIDGNDGRDTMVFNGAAAAETVDLSANGGRLRFFRNPGNVTMDTHGVEFVTFNALGGADNVAIHDLAGADVTSVDLDLAGTLGGSTGDGQTDRVVLDGTNGDDAVTVAGNASDVNVTGLVPAVNLLHTDAADQLDLETFSGIDTVASGGLAPGAIQLFLDGILIP